MPGVAWKHLDALQVAAEGGQAGKQALLVPDVRQHHGEGREPGRGGSGHGHACLGHQHSQPKCLQGHAQGLRVHQKDAEHSWRSQPLHEIGSSGCPLAIQVCSVR